jgi:hypothetical protein
VRTRRLLAVQFRGSAPDVSRRHVTPSYTFVRHAAGWWVPVYPWFDSRERQSSLISTVCTSSPRHHPTHPPLQWAAENRPEDGEVKNVWSNTSTSPPPAVVSRPWYVITFISGPSVRETNVPDGRLAGLRVKRPLFDFYLKVERVEKFRDPMR